MIAVPADLCSPFPLMTLHQMVPQLVRQHLIERETLQAISAPAYRRQFPFHIFFDLRAISLKGRLIRFMQQERKPPGSFRNRIEMDFAGEEILRKDDPFGSE